MNENRHPFEDAALRILRREVEPSLKAGHPTAEAFLDYMADELAMNDREAMNAHCLICEDCRVRLETLLAQLSTAEQGLHRATTKGWSFSTLFQQSLRVSKIADRRHGRLNLMSAFTSACAGIALLAFSLPAVIQGSQGLTIRGESSFIVWLPFFETCIGVGCLALAFYLVRRRR